MIDKLDKWIHGQKLFNSLLGKEYLAMRIELPPIPDIEFPEAPICPPLGKVKDINDYIKEAVDKEREACAKLCDDAFTYDPDDPGGGFAVLIRERSDD